jgi:hypothetical protein
MWRAAVVPEVHQKDLVFVSQFLTNPHPVIKHAEKAMQDNDGEAFSEALEMELDGFHAAKIRVKRHMKKSTILNSDGALIKLFSKPGQYILTAACNPEQILLAIHRAKYIDMYAVKVGFINGYDERICISCVLVIKLTRSRAA